jgi:hypothetical protein
MAFGGISYIAIFFAAIAGFAVGAAWYGALGRQWMKAARIAPGSARMSPSLFVTSLIALIVMAWILAGLIGHLGPGQVTVRNGVISGLFVWAGFVATTLAVNHRYGGFGWNLTAIDGGHWLAVLLVMGAVIGAFGGA